MSESINARKLLFVLQEISACGDGVYKLKLSRDGRVVVTECNIERVDGGKLNTLDVIKFKSDEFNGLCSHGDIYLKPISKVIFAFHECFQGAAE